MTFPKAVAACPQLRDHYRTGLTALGADRERVTIDEGRRISGSVNIELAQRQAGGQEHTWDYGIGITAAREDIAVWVEVHGANCLHVQLLLDKLQSLRVFLRDCAPGLDSLPKRFVWLATGSVYIAPNSRERRRLNQAGLQLRSKRLDLEEVL